MRTPPVRRVPDVAEEGRPVPASAARKTRLVERMRASATAWGLALEQPAAPQWALDNWEPCIGAEWTCLTPQARATAMPGLSPAAAAG